jgi:hypothetical protein
VDPRRWPGALVRHHLVPMIGTSSFWYISHQPRYISHKHVVTHIDQSPGCVK